MSTPAVIVDCFCEGIIVIPEAENIVPGPSGIVGDENEERLQSTQVPLDLVDEASMESFPCSDPPSYTTSHS